MASKAVSKPTSSEAAAASASPKRAVSYGSATSAGGALAAFAAYDKDGDGKIDADEILNLDADGDGVITEEEIAEVLRRMKAMGNVAAHAQQRIGLLDADMAKLRERRAKLGRVQERQAALLARARADEAAAAAALAKLEAANKVRLEDRRRILAALARAEKEMAAFVGGVGATKRQVVYHYTEHVQHEASLALEAARGYSTGTTHKKHSEGVELDMKKHAK